MYQQLKDSYPANDDDAVELQQHQNSTTTSSKLPSEKLITDDVKLRMEVIQSLTEPCNRKIYIKKIVKYTLRKRKILPKVWV